MYNKFCKKLILVDKGVCMKFSGLVFLIILSMLTEAYAQYSAQNDAVYMATLKAVADYKIGDEENLKDVENLRANQRFLLDLRKMLDKLSNRRSKNSTNTRVYNILLKAGKEIYNELK